MSSGYKTSSTRYLQTQKDWEHYEEALVTKFVAEGMPRLEAKRKAKTVMAEQNALKAEAEQKKQAERKLYPRGRH